MVARQNRSGMVMVLADDLDTCVLFREVGNILGLEESPENKRDTVFVSRLHPVHPRCSLTLISFSSSNANVTKEVNPALLYRDERSGTHVLYRLT
ncbi:hypothetical protein KQX54_012546 [Cotesia glomerata]|uniref:Uncharacterized protein n=1 Tax=Cotesia glomerata TaxID=32391 RepID=A0AAV7J3V2_COTGL|nr:hypothetical protein KQX54_012546 [Cotesia glomerata]